MRQEITRNSYEDPRINYRGKDASRLDNVTDAVFGFAITLLIFNSSNPNSFDDLFTFTKTLPAFLISISFLILIWHEHLSFSRIYSLEDFWLKTLNTAFLAVVIFYVYPLRFLTVFLTNFFFGTGIEIELSGRQMPDLMIYYGAITASLYIILYLFYLRAAKLQEKLALNTFEQFHVRHHAGRLAIMFSVPVISIIVTALLKPHSIALSSILGGVAYNLYIPLIFWWQGKYRRKIGTFDQEL